MDDGIILKYIQQKLIPSVFKQDLLKLKTCNNPKTFYLKLQVLISMVLKSI